MVWVLLKEIEINIEWMEILMYIVVDYLNI